MNLANGGIGIKMAAYENNGFEQDSDILDDLDNQTEITEDQTDEDEEFYSPTVVPSDTDTKSVEWDVFMNKEERKKEWVDSWSWLHKVLRFLVCDVLFLLVLGTATLSTLSFLFMTYNINPSGANVALNVHNGSTYIFKDGRRKTNVRWIWAIMVAVSAPYLFTLFRSLQKMIFKKQRSIKFVPLLIVLFIESIHSFGLLMFVFLVLPSVDAIFGILLFQGTATIPSILRLFWKKNKNSDMNPLLARDKSGSSPWKLTALVACLVQLTFVALASYKIYDQIRSLELTCMISASLVLISFGYWNNFVQRPHKSHVEDMYTKRKLHMNKYNQWEVPKNLKQLAKLIDVNTVKISLVVSVWKIVLTLGIPMIYFTSGDPTCIQTFFFRQSSATNCTPHSITLTDSMNDNCSIWYYLPFTVAAINIASGLLGYKMAKGACKIRAQELCFSVPLILSTPLSLVLVVTSYMYKQTIFTLVGCANVWYGLSSGDKLSDFLLAYTQGLWLPIIVFGFVSFILITSHIWTPRSPRMASTDRLFIRPLYCTVLFMQSLTLGRRTDDSVNTNKKIREKIDDANKELKGGLEYCPLTDAKTPKIYACATMWHETEVEMNHLLKSVFRMDMDQFKRKMLWRLFTIHDTDYYEFEAHIFFDNAFEDHPADDFDYTVNEYVKKFAKVFTIAARSVYPPKIKLDSPLKVPTPYGGRLEYVLPGQNLLVVHLKNKDKIRIKKRWSQVMYMYYFLSYKLVCKNTSSKTLDKKARNTFILALDGDVDFNPAAVQMLLDRMKKDGNVGAACGRIHPVGAGPMVWYQKFEYAVSHWLQKATEHNLGCVLCCPGCFSMFRASALMDYNVLKKYTQVSSEARHYVQYDQGEDRWLCTLLLQQGHKVEYCAAADAKTFAPEGFKEFFNQRRRWTPSTMANILDIIMSWSKLRKKNDDISFLFLCYQVFLFVSSVLTPGTIFMLIFGAINTAYPNMSLYAAMLANLVPVGIFVILCFTTKDDIQLTYVSILSAFYSLVMMIVLVGLLKQISQSGFCSLTAMFFLYVAGVFIIAAILHPQEFLNVLHGFLYFLAIPSTSMLLMFYSLANLNVVSWGTREEYKAPVNEKEEPVTKKKKKSFYGKHQVTKNESSDYTFSFGNMFRCLCCPRPDTKQQDMLGVIVEKIEDLEYAFRHRDEDEEEEDPRPYDTSENEQEPTMPNYSSQDVERIRWNPMFQEDSKKSRDDLKNPFWIEDRDLGAGGIGALPEEEKDFWTNMIDTYLLPLKQSPEQKIQMEFELKELRNKVCLFFFLSNCLFVTLIFILESVSEYTPSLTFELPCDVEGATPAKLEPIAIAFTLIFGILLFIQFLSMIVHRYSTLLHIVSHTKLRMKGKNTQDRRKQEFLNLLEEMQKTEQDDDTESIQSSSFSDYGGDSSTGTYTARRRGNLMRALTFKTKAGEASAKDLQDVFEDNFKLIGKALDSGLDNEDDITTKPSLRNFGAKSLFSLVNMDPNDKKRIIEKSKKNWGMLKEKFPLPKPAMSVTPKMAEWVDIAVRKSHEGTIDFDASDAGPSAAASNNPDGTKPSLWSKPRQSLGFLSSSKDRKSHEGTIDFDASDAGPSAAASNNPDGDGIKPSLWSKPRQSLGLLASSKDRKSHEGTIDSDKTDAGPSTAASNNPDDGTKPSLWSKPRQSLGFLTSSKDRKSHEGTIDSDKTDAGPSTAASTNPDGEGTKPSLWSKPRQSLGFLTSSKDRKSHEGTIDSDKTDAGPSAAASTNPDGDGTKPSLWSKPRQSLGLLASSKDRKSHEGTIDSDKTDAGPSTAASTNPDGGGTKPSLWSKPRQSLGFLTSSKDNVSHVTDTVEEVPVKNSQNKWGVVRKSVNSLRPDSKKVEFTEEESSHSRDVSSGNICLASDSSEEKQENSVNILRPDSKKVEFTEEESSHSHVVSSGNICLTSGSNEEKEEHSVEVRLRQGDSDTSDGNKNEIASRQEIISETKF